MKSFLFYAVGIGVEGWILSNTKEEAKEQFYSNLTIEQGMKTKTLVCVAERKELV